jgi:hypothetical protein
MFPPLLDPAHDSLADDICGLSAHIGAAHAELAAKCARFNATLAWSEGGTRSCAEFLSQSAGLDLVTGHDLVSVGDALNRLPLLAEARAAGELSFDKARAVASVATEVDQEMWVELARQCTGSQLVRIGRAFRRAMAAAEPEQDRRHQVRRGLIQTWRDDGMVRLVALLTPEDGALVLAALGAVTGGKPVPEDDPAVDRWAANRADALVAICDNALAKAPEDLGSSPASTQLVVQVDAAVLDRCRAGRGLRAGGRSRHFAEPRPPARLRLPGHHRHDAGGAADRRRPDHPHDLAETARRASRPRPGLPRSGLWCPRPSDRGSSHPPLG